MERCLKVTHTAWKKRWGKIFTYSLTVVWIRGTLKVANCRFTACSSSSRGFFFISFLFSISWSKAFTPFSTCKHTWHCQYTNTHLAMALWVHIYSPSRQSLPPQKRCPSSVLSFGCCLTYHYCTVYYQLPTIITRDRAHCKHLRKYCIFPVPYAF